jgi:hypothetical protein
MIVAIDGGSIASRTSDSSAAPVAESPCPRAMAASIEALGTAFFFAVTRARARRGFMSGFGPAIFTANVMSRVRRDRCLLLPASFLALSCLIEAHFL